jgi:hypothetical protein
MERKAEMPSPEDISGALAKNIVTVPEVVKYITDLVLRLNRIAETYTTVVKRMRDDPGRVPIGLEQGAIVELMKLAKSFRDGVATSLPRFGLSRDDSDERALKDLFLFIQGHTEIETRTEELPAGEITDQALRILPNLVKGMEKPLDFWRDLERDPLLRLWNAAKAFWAVANKLDRALYPAEISM